MRRLLMHLGCCKKTKSVFLSERFPQYRIGRGAYGDLRIRS